MAGICASAAPISTKSTNVEDVRRTITYHPTVWGDHFLSYTSDVTKINAAEKEQLETQKEKVRKLLAQTPDDSTLKIELIDAIQRLGVGYHFEDEIDESLRKIHQTQTSQDKGDLRVVALRFRLLRQQGYRVQCDVFDKYLDEGGNFKEALIDDVEGMIGLYEASYYAVQGEEILDKALQFSSSHLESLLHQSTTTSFVCRRVKEAFEMPISKTLIRLGASKFISNYQDDESRNQDLLNFAKSDFKILQKIHQNELYHLTRWWEDLGMAKKLGFARDRMVEVYFWSLGIYFELHYNTARIFLTKVLAMLTLVDDIYDVYGNLDDLRRFTHAIESWDMSASGVDGLPEYMRICYEALLGVYAEMDDEILAKQGQSYRLHYAKQELKRLVKSYMEEAEWSYSKYVPTMDEYMKVSLVSGAYTMVATTFLVGILGDDHHNSITIHDFDWITNDPSIMQASEILARLMDDLAGHGKEQKITAVGCYMNEHGCSEMEASRELWKQVKKGWKDLNNGCMEPRAASTQIIMCILNMCRVLHVMYSTGEDGFTNSTTRTKHAIQSLLVDPTLS